MGDWRKMGFYFFEIAFVNFQKFARKLDASPRIGMHVARTKDSSNHSFSTDQICFDGFSFGDENLKSDYASSAWKIHRTNLVTLIVKDGALRSVNGLQKGLERLEVSLTKHTQEIVTRT